MSRRACWRCCRGETAMTNNSGKTLTMLIGGVVIVTLLAFLSLSSVAATFAWMAGGGYGSGPALCQSVTPGSNTSTPAATFTPGGKTSPPDWIRVPPRYIVCPKPSPTSPRRCGCKRWRKAADGRTQNSKPRNAWPQTNNKTSRSAPTCSRFAKANSIRACAIATAPSKS